jgi:hypothetical protein
MVRLLRTGGITVALCGIFFLLGILFADVALGFQLRDSIASLLGAALGAAITVAGSFWLVGAAESYNSDRFKRLVRDNIRFMREQAQTTKGSLEEADANDFAALFEQLAPFAEITDYSARIALQKLQQTLFTEKRYIEKEIDWLSRHHTIPVLRQGAQNFGAIADRITEAADTALREL